MLLINPRILFLAMGTFLVLIPGMGIRPLTGGTTEVVSGFSYTIKTNPGDKFISEGYKAIAPGINGFVAAGSEGRIDWISPTGEIIKSQKILGENFSCILSYDKEIILAGENGAIYTSVNNDEFIRVNNDFKKSINTITMFKGNFIAGTDNGELLMGHNPASFKKIALNLKGNIVSLSSGKNDCFGVSDAGEIMHTSDGEKWDILDFNEVYKGFYPSCYFSCILVTEKNIAIAGINENGSPVTMFSAMGNVWSERELVYNNESGRQVFLEDRPNDIYYDSTRDIFYIVCRNGILMKLPSCSHCNELIRISAGNLAGISGNNGILMIIGEDFFIQPVNPD